MKISEKQLISLILVLQDSLKFNDDEGFCIKTNSRLQILKDIVNNQSDEFMNILDDCEKGEDEK